MQFYSLIAVRLGCDFSYAASKMLESQICYKQCYRKNGGASWFDIRYHLNMSARMKWSTEKAGAGAEVKRERRERERQRREREKERERVRNERETLVRRK